MATLPFRKLVVRSKRENKYVGYRSECMVMSYGIIGFPCVSRCCCIERVMNSVIQKGRATELPNHGKGGHQYNIAPCENRAP